MLLALGQYNWAELVIWLGIPPNLYFAVPALFNPGFAIRKGYQRPGVETVWARNAGLLIFIITGYHVVAAIDAERFLAVAWGTVAGLGRRRRDPGPPSPETEPMKFESKAADLQAAGLSSPAMRDGLHHANVHGHDLRYFRAGTGTPVVLLHTLRTQLEYFEPLIRHLDLAKIEVFAVDLPGHGESSAPPVDYTAGYFTDEVEGFLETCDITAAIVAGDSIGASIGLLLAARRNPRVGGVVAVNTYDYGRWGGVRRNSLLANVLFTTLLVPGIGRRSAYRDGVADPACDAERPPRSGQAATRPGRSNASMWLTSGAPAGLPLAVARVADWIDAREQYPAIEIPVTLAYGDGDWARPDEREANARVIPGARAVTIKDAGHSRRSTSPKKSPADPRRL